MDEQEQVLEAPRQPAGTITLVSVRPITLGMVRTTLSPRAPVGSSRSKVREEMIPMVRVTIEIRCETARFVVAVQAKSIQQALGIVTTRYPGSVARVTFPIRPEDFFVEDLAA